MSAVSSSEMQKLLGLNDLMYQAPRDGSLVNSRSTKKYNFSPLNYTNLAGSPQVVFNNGSDYIYGPNSYVRLTVVYNQAVAETADWSDPANLTNNNSGGSAFNLFSECRITSRSGAEIGRTSALNNLVSSLIQYEHDQDFREYAKVFGAFSQENLQDGDQEYMLPLALFHPMFAQETLIPANLLSGARLTLTFDSINNVLFSDGALGTLDVNDMELVLDSVDLYDSVKRAINLQMANNKNAGIQFPYSEWVNVQRSGTVQNLNFDINVSASKVSKVLMKTRRTANLGVATADGMASEPYELGSTWRLRLGNQLFPQVPVDAVSQAYVQTIEALAGNGNDDVDAMKDMKKEYKVGVDYASYKSATGKVPVIAWNVERSQVLNLSGIPTNNSRQLNVEAVYDNSTDRRIDVYVKVLKVSNVFADNVVVDI